MNLVDAWARGYARQADADLKAWELYQEFPAAVAAECHKLLFLQMACEKLCKAHLIQSGTPPQNTQASHVYVANPLPIIIKQEMIERKQNAGSIRELLRQVRRIAQEIEVLNPAADRAGKRPDNCEYPWQVGETVVSPLDVSFAPSNLLTQPAGRTFLKLLRCAIDRVLMKAQAKL